MRAAYIPTIAELQAFAACAEFGATTRAAEALSLTQSAISRSLNSLEERLGVRLFHRVRQRLVLSDAGRALKLHADRLLADLNDAALTVMAFGGHKEVLRLAVLPTFGSIWLIPRLAAFQTIAPEMTFDISSRLEPVDFESDPFDAAIQRGEHQPPGALIDVLMDEHLVVVAAPTLLPDGEVLDDQDLARLPLLQQATRPSLWLDWFVHGGLDPRSILRGARFQHFDMVIHAAKAGYGLALVPEVLVKADLASGQLVLASPRRLRGPEPYTLIYPPRSQDLEGFRHFRQWLAEEADK